MDKLVKELETQQLQANMASVAPGSRPHEIFELPELVLVILSFLPSRHLPRLALVSRTFCDASRTLMLSDVVVAPAGMDTFLDKLDSMGQNIRTLELTLEKHHFDLLATIPAKAPNISKLHISSQAFLVDVCDPFASFLTNCKAIKHLHIANRLADAKSQFRRRDIWHPDSSAGTVFRALCNANLSQYLHSLELDTVVLFAAEIDILLSRVGNNLKSLRLLYLGDLLELATIIEQHCPALTSLSISMQVGAQPSIRSHARAEHLSFGSQLRHLELTCLLGLPAQTFAIFAEPSSVQLESIRISHSDITHHHVSYLRYVRDLTLIGCRRVRTIPVFCTPTPAQNGPGCRELRRLSLLQTSGLPLRALWHLGALSHMPIVSGDERTWRQAHGLTGRGLRKLSVDCVQFRLDAFSPPEDLPPLESDPLTDQGVGAGGGIDFLRCPPALERYMDYNVLSSDLPSGVLLACLNRMTHIEKISLYGSTGPSGDSSTASEIDRTTSAFGRLMLGNARSQQESEQEDTRTGRLSEEEIDWLRAHGAPNLLSVQV